MSIRFDITPFLKPDDRWLPTERPEDIQRCYDFKHSVAQLVRPRSIFEIGVRAGYSAAAFLSAVPDARYVGVDSNTNAHGGIIGYIQHARETLGRQFRNVTILQLNTQIEAVPLDQVFDLVHVDGDHTFAGALSDLLLVERYGRYLLIDDHDHLPQVKSAIQTFLAMRNYGYIHFPSFRGDVLIRTGLP